MNSHFRAVLFDLDGTLADLANAVNHALTTLRCPPHPLNAYRYLVGNGARNLCARALPADRQHLADETLRLMRAHYDIHCFDETRLYPGIPELVAALHRQGYRLAVFSNKPDDFTKRMVAHYFPSNPFDTVRGQLPGHPLKPDPTVALQITRELAIPPRHWLYLGDSNTDMKTAVAAGMYPVGVLWGFRDRDELVAAGAKELIATPADLLRQIANRP